MTAKDLNDYVIGSEDVLAVNVWKEPEISRAVIVRSDGKISLPLLGEIQAAGTTPKQLQTEIAQGLAPFISDPEVAVIVQTINSKKYSILGQVLARWFVFTDWTHDGPRRDCSRRRIPDFRQAQENLHIANRSRRSRTTYSVQLHRGH